VRVRILFGLSTLALAVTVAACSDDKAATPTQPTQQAPVAPTLTAPQADTPDDDQQLDTLQPSLRVVNATSNQAGAKTYEFQISDDSNFSAASALSYSHVFKVVASKTGVAEDPSGKTTFQITDDMQPTTRFYWRARVHQGTTDGPWSTTRSFKTQIQGYNRAGELYDPLVNGLTVGAMVGSVTLTAGRGATINTNDSHIRYILAQTLTAGEFSLNVTGVANDSTGDKTKIMAMYDGNGDITTSNWRCTVEKRDGGIVAWRFIAGAPGAAQIDTGPDQRLPVGFSPSQVYGWKATWGGGFRVQVRGGGLTGPNLYDEGANLGAVYQPNPHMAFLGSPIGRAGPGDASTPGATYTNVYIGNGARPTSLGSALIDKGISQAQRAMQSSNR
jgi:hypothetical protein